MTYSLRRKSDNAGDEGGMSMIYWMEDGKVKTEHGQKPRLGAGIRVGSINGRSYASQDYWSTTPVTEILEETETMVRFKTRSNSEYIWEIF